MRFLFVHQNFPGQFRRIAPILAGMGHEVWGIGSQTARHMPGVTLAQYNFESPDSRAVHRFARTYNAQAHRAQKVLKALYAIGERGFVPDVIVGHTGWGEVLPLRQVHPKARIISFCEFYHCREAGIDASFDPEFPPPSVEERITMNMNNAGNIMALAEADLGWSPTEWQRSTYPSVFHPKIEVLHEGIDTDAASPRGDASVRLPNGRVLTAKDEVLTYVARNLEPVRGTHIFMRALPEILKKRPNAQVLVVGGDSVSYGAQPPEGETWRSHYFNEVKDRIDTDRVHFFGVLGYQDYLSVLQISTAHVYLTYPFVLSWSMLEAMSTGCLVIGSDTPPVREVIDGTNGLLTPFFDVERLAGTVAEALAHPHRYLRLREKARRDMIARYDTKRQSLPKMLKLFGVSDARPVTREQALV